MDFSGIRTAADITPAVIDQLHEAFTTIGFVIITNHGVEEKVRVIVHICCIHILWCYHLNDDGIVL